MEYVCTSVSSVFSSSRAFGLLVGESVLDHSEGLPVDGGPDR
jgi:hypothetical protein